MTIGSQIINLRKKAKISQEKLAEKLGITRQTLSSYENDITSPDLIMAKKISEVLCISIDELVGNNSTLSAKINNTEKLVRKQTKFTKTLIIIIYFIIMALLISLIIYWTTKKDYTKEYQTEFTCYNKREKDYVRYSIESEPTLYKDESDEVIIKNYYINSYRCDNENNCYHENMYGGESIGEAIYSLLFVKKVMIGNGYTCR